MGCARVFSFCFANRFALYIYYNSSIDLLLLLTHYWNLHINSTGMTLKLNHVYNSWTNSRQYFYWCCKGKNFSVQPAAGTANIGIQRNMTASFLVQYGAQLQQCTMLLLLQGAISIPAVHSIHIFRSSWFLPLLLLSHYHTAAINMDWHLHANQILCLNYKGICACRVWLRHTWQTPCEHTPA